MFSKKKKKVLKLHICGLQSVIIHFLSYSFFLVYLKQSNFVMKTVKTALWHVVYVKPRTELTVAKRLKGLGIEVYVPTRTEVRQWSDRKKKVQVVLLPSMVLVCLEEKEINLVFQVPGVVRYLFEQGKRAIIQHQEIKAMQAYVSGEVALSKDAVQVGGEITVPQLKEQGVVVALQGKKCLARLERLGAVVSFQLQ